MLWLFFIPIIALGILTSYEDIKFGKIRNKWITLAVLVSILLHIFLYFNSNMNLLYIETACVHLLFALIIAVFIWFIGFWSAGDAKLFFAYSSLVPLVFYTHITTQLSHIEIIINTVIPIFLFLLYKIIFHSSKKQKIESIKKIFSPKYVLNYLLVVFSVMFFTSILFSLLGIQSNYIFSILSIFIFMKLFRMLFKKYTTHFLIFVCIIRLILQYEIIFTPEFLKSFLILSLSYALIRRVVYDLGKIFTDKVKIRDLREGMIPAELVLKDGSKKPAGFYSYTQMDDKNYLIKTSVEGLTKIDIKVLQKCHSKKWLKFNKLRMQQTLPFAPFMLAGVVLTILAQGNLILFLVRFI